MSACVCTKYIVFKLDAVQLNTCAALSIRTSGAFAERKTFETHWHIFSGIS